MDILLAPGIFPPDSGGPATFAPDLGEALTTRGHGVRIVTNGTAPEEFDDESPFEVTRIERGGSTPRLYARQIRTIRREIRRFDPDVVLANAFDLQTALATISTGVPTITKIVGDYAWERARRKVGLTDHIDAFQTTTYGPRVEFYKRLRSFQTRQMDRVVVPSEYLRTMVTGWGVSEPRTSVIYNAIDIEVPSVPDGDRADRIVTVGRLVNWKGIDGVIDAFADITADSPKTELHVVGDGPERDALEARAAATDAADRIVFHGRVDHERVLELVARSRVFTLNSTYEGLPHVVLEAMACGTPVVASAAGGTPEVVHDGETGLLVDPGDTDALARAFGRVLDDADLRASLRAGADELLAERFSHERMIDEYESLLQEVAGEA